VISFDTPEKRLATEPAPLNYFMAWGRLLQAEAGFVLLERVIVPDGTSIIKGRKASP
jgi:hypothetical protein